MLRVTSLLSTCVLLAAVGCNNSDTAKAAPAQAPVKDKLVHQADGTVQYNGHTYDTMSTFLQSPEFRANNLRCGTREQPPTVINGVPEDCDFNSTTIAQEYEVADGAEVLQIPVIFHVILDQPAGTGNIDNAFGYISQERIDEQMRVLNYDFRALEGTPGGTAEAFDSAIQFVLATNYPDTFPQNPALEGTPLPNHPITGQPQRGVLYVESPQFFNDSDSGTPSDMKTALHWDTAQYLNVYVNDPGGGILGYSYFPQWRPTEPFLQEDGIVMLWCTIGGDQLNDPACAPYHLGRTFTHEVGHWVGLFHTFQDGCGDGYTGGDRVADTHPESGPFFGCTPNPGDSCGDGLPDPIENYMDYSDDICMTRYTPEQTNRARCSIKNYRGQLDPVQDNFLPTPGFDFASNLLDFSFTDTSTDMAGMLVAWDWDFGDGGTSNLQDPAHSYPIGGVYDVRLTVTDNDGNRRSVTQQVVAGSPPTAGFTYTTNGFVAYFTDTSTDVAPGTVTQWFWNFGDGGTSTQQNPQHAYGTAGTYTVSLTAYDDGGLPDTYSADVTLGFPPKSEFLANVHALDVDFTDTSTTPSGTVNSWTWDFGDGSGTSTMQNPSYSYATGGLYNVTLTVGNDNGDTDSYSRNVFANARPSVSFTAAVDYLDVAFTDTSTDPDSQIVGWYWDFGDNSSSSMQNPSHTYAFASNWNVTLQVTDQHGNVAISTQTVRSVFPPVADAGPSNSGDAGNPVNGGGNEGCACAVGQSENDAPWPAAALFLGLGLFILRRRKKS